MKFIKILFEKHIFGVSSWWGSTLGIKTSFIRLFFIYGAFANSFTIFIYLIMVFILKIRNHFKYRRKSVFDL
ncbi:MAG: PspC family transcriptional regulator [Flavobacteriales bacterium]|nr:PspC family transcriptional regulator [Flavobacteriales bacterium]